MMQTPDSVISHLHMPIVKLNEHTGMPFITTQQPHMPPASIVHRFCTMLQAVLSSQTQVIFTPPAHLSHLMWPRGTMRKLLTGVVVGVPRAGVPIVGTPTPDTPMLVRSIMTVLLDMLPTPFHEPA